VGRLKSHVAVVRQLAAPPDVVIMTVDRAMHLVFEVTLAGA
jgi:hypothetical protein